MNKFHFLYLFFLNFDVSLGGTSSRKKQTFFIFFFLFGVVRGLSLVCFDDIVSHGNAELQLRDERPFHLFLSGLQLIVETQTTTVSSPVTFSLKCPGCYLTTALAQGCKR